MFSKLLCFIGLHHWGLKLFSKKHTGYDKWSRMYQYEGEFYCERDCGVPDRIMYWEE